MAYSELKVHGGCDVNYIWSKTSYFTKGDIDEIADNGIMTYSENSTYQDSVPKWDDTTVTLSKFTDNLGASDLSNGTIIAYSIQRKATDEEKLYKVAEVTPDFGNVSDFNVASKSSYHYYIIPIYKDGQNKSYGTPIVTQNTATDFNSWSIIGLIPTDRQGEYAIDNENIWTFYINIESDAITHHTSKTLTEGFGRFPRIQSGKADYLSGGLSCYIGQVNCFVEYIDDNIKKLERWRKFCASSCLKLLRDPKGHIIPCEITDSSYNITDNFSALQTVLSFNYTQIADSRDITAYATE